MAVLESLQAVTWHRTKQETASDANMHQLVSIIENGIPEAINDLPPPLRTYHRFREHLHTLDGVILYKDRIVIPPSLRNDVLAALHSAHQGTSQMTARAESSIFWPGITSDIIDIRLCCSHCKQNNTLTALCTTSTTGTTSVSIPMHLCGLLHPQGKKLLGYS